MNNGIEKKDSKRNIIFICIFIFFVIASIVGFFIVTKASNNIAKNTEAKLSEQNAKEINAHMTSNIDAAIQELHDHAVVVSSAYSGIDNSNLDYLVNYLAKLDANTDFYHAMLDDEGYLYDANGRRLATASLSFFGDFLYFKENMLTDNETVDGNDYVFYALYLDKNIKVDGHNICGVLIGIRNDQLAKKVRLDSEYSMSYASIIMDNGYYIIKNDNEHGSGKNEFGILKENGVSEEEINNIKNKIDDEGNCLIQVNFIEEGDHYLYFSRLERNTNWIVVNHIPAEYIRASLQDMKSDLNNLMLAICISIFAFSIIMLAILFNNIRQLKESRKQLASALINAEQANRAKTTFLNNMSHDIRTPMNAIIGLINIASKNNNNPRVQDALDKIESSSSYLLSLINDVLDISRIESGKTTLTLKPFCLNEIVDETSIIIRDYIKDKALAFNIIKEDTPFFVNADKMRIQEILINILSNAVKYTKEGSVTFKEEVSKAEDDNHVNVCYTVTDTGIGMSEEFQKRLFHEFEQEATDARTKYKGTGLGMTITKKLVEMMHGEIIVNSKQGVGTTVIIKLKLELAKDVKVEKKDVVIEPVDLSGRHALLVEDNDINAEIATFVLEDFKMKVTWAKDGEEAVKIFSQSKPNTFDVILMDVMMPKMDGYEATKAIRALTNNHEAKTIPIIGMSANAYSEDKQKAYEIGMNDYVTKPISPEALLNTLSKYLHNK